MGLRKKIVLIMIPVTLLSILLVNAAFGAFFVNYLKKQEYSQIETDCDSLLRYVNDRRIDYIGAANDWGHWDETYDFMLGRNDSYPYVNLNEDTFVNLDINFFILCTPSKEIYYKKYFENGHFSSFTESFIEDIRAAAVKLQGRFDTGGFYYLDGNYYFLASTGVTDSLMENPESGMLIVGRKLDPAVLRDIENLLNINIESLSAMDEAVYGWQLSQGLGGSWTENGRSEIFYNCIIPASPSYASFVLSKPRDLYISGMASLNSFILISALSMFLILSAMFFALGRNMSQPLVRLTGEVSRIDTSGKINRIKEQGKYEFAFLERTINRLLENIDNEHSNLRESEEKLYAILTSVGDGVAVVDRDMRITFMNPAAERITGWRESSAIGRALDDVFIILDEYTRKRIESPVKRAFDSNTVYEHTGNALLVDKNKRRLPVESSAAPLRGKEGGLTGCVLVVHDFSERREKQREIEYLSYHDQLTGLYNRRYFEHELARLDTRRNLPLSILYADVNGLKTLNDAFGHTYGDELVKKVADVMKKTCRKSDIIARTGGDEFVIVLPGTAYEDAMKLAGRMARGIGDISINDINVSISVGGHTKETADQPIWDVLKIAEDSMYSRKIYYNASQRSSIIKSILNTLKLKSPREDAHSQRVSALCEDIARAYGLEEYRVAELKLAGELHDIGKIAIDERVLNKPGRLDPEEREQIKKHPETGFRLLSTSNEFYSLAEYVLAHHERWDGKGYPKGLKGEEINWQARVIAIADSYDAMTCGRPYKAPLGREEAIAEIKKNAGTQFDPDIVRVFVQKVLGED